MNLEEQVLLHKEISLKIQELEVQKKALTQSILQEITSTSLQLGRYFVRRCSRLSIAVPLDQARHYDAVKLEEVVDKEKLKTLYKNGMAIPGVSESEYIVVSLRDESALESAPF